MASDFLAILTPLLNAVETSRPSQQRINQVYPQFTPMTVMRDDSLAELPRLVIVRGTDPPPTGFGETVREVDPVPNEGAWRQTWVVDKISVPTAKEQTRLLAISVYWRKMYAEPSEQEINAGNADPTQIQASRLSRFRPKLVDVRNRINAIADNSPTGVQDAYAIYRELEAIP